jgi:hypothetical protein
MILICVICMSCCRCFRTRHQRRGGHTSGGKPSGRPETASGTGINYSSKLEDWPLEQALTQEDVRDLAEYCLMFFADLSEEQMKLLDQLRTPGAEIRGAGRVWAADMVATAWRLYVPRQALRDGSPVFDRYRRFLARG